MPISDLDSDQRHAATSEAGETAIVAGAGSGKTRLMVARYLTLAGREDMPLSSIAAITFTNKAADQMKVRIAGEARALAERDPVRADRWLAVADGAHRAPISTIHSFCSSILRRFPLEAGVDPLFTIIDQTANVTLLRQAVDDELADLLAGGGSDAELPVRLFGLGQLKRLLYTMLGMRTKVLAFLDTADHGYPPDSDVIRGLYERHMTGRLDSMIEALDQFHALKPEGDKLALVYDHLRASLRDVRRSIETRTAAAGDIEQMLQSVTVRGGSKAKWGEETIRQVRDGLKEARGLLSDIAGYYRYEREMIPSATALLLELFVRAEARFRRAKLDQGRLDHDDLLIETWRLLRSNFTVLATVSGSFRHLMVDEFQDTDGMQMDIIRMIAGNSSASLFTVGDPKQSIYRFRGADVTVFNGFVQDIESFRMLSTNYRSAPGILTFVNTVFGRIMGDEPQTAYDTIYFPMKPHRQADPVHPPAEIMVAAGGSGDVKRRTEAAAIVARIRQLTAPDAACRYACGDMVILLRTSTQLTVYEEALLEAGIPFVNRIGGKLAGSPEAYDIGNLLGWLAHPDDPVLLTAVLMSPFFSLDGDDLLHLRVKAGSPDRMGAYLRTYAAHPDLPRKRIGHAARILNELAETADRLTVRELLDRAFDATGYTLVMAADPITGDRSLAVIDLIVDAAEQYERGGGMRREFADLLRSGQPFTDAVAQVETAGDAVSLMTIHGSKGLEFKVVFLADITGAGSTGGSALVFDETLGPGYMIADNRGGARTTYARTWARATDKRKDRAESRRLFYVGCTRAEDLLVISGGPPAKNGGSDSTNWMSWLHEALDIPADGSADGMVTDLFRYRWYDSEADEAAPAEADIVHEVADGGAAVRAILDTPVPGPLTPAPSDVISVTDLLCMADEMDGVTDVYGLAEEDRFENGVSGGKQYGTLIHHVLERIDLAAPDTWTAAAHGLLSGAGDVPDTFEPQLADDLARFAGSGLYQECARASRIYREEPFVLAAGSILIRGTIDLLFTAAETGDIVLADYKTGMLPSPESPLMARYRRQLALYADAVYKAAGVLPSRLVVYFISHGEAVTIPCTPALVQETETLIETLCRRMTTV